MTTLSEAKPSMLRGVEGWVNIVVRGCLEGMGEIPEDDTEAWLEADPAEDPTDDTYPHTYEHALDRLACALGGGAVLPPAFAFIPAMLASHDWRLRHAGLMAIAAIAEGTSKVMQQELGKIVECVEAADSRSRLLHAASTWDNRSASSYVAQKKDRVVPRADGRRCPPAVCAFPLPPSPPARGEVQRATHTPHGPV
ncbi:hypothetical protein OH77DRAFT_1515060, partial [Trametes cingulata]